MTSRDDRRLWPGTVPPRAGSPARRPGSVRRTTTIDLLRPDGLSGPLVITGSGRDLVTGCGSGDRSVPTKTTAEIAPGVAGIPAAEVAAESRLQVEVDYTGDRTITAVSAHPHLDGIEALVGLRAGSGFRRSLSEMLPTLATSSSIVHQLLDEVPPGTLIAGSALARNGLVHLAAGPTSGSRAPVDICAGWQQGGAMFDAIAETGIPLLGWGPPAPALEPVGDPLAWHPMTDLAPMSLRRRRLVDVSQGLDGLDVQVRFRDSYWEDDGTETVVHEYSVAATVDPATWTVTSVAAEPGPLPAPECPSAAASAERLVGQSLSTLRALVRDTFTGTSTCTHLNDVFRSLADVEHLWRLPGCIRPRRDPVPLR